MSLKKRWRVNNMKISLGFTGDIAFSEYTKDFYKTPGVIDRKIYDFLNSNDYNILNFESPVTESTITKKNALAHKSSPDALSFIKDNIKNPVLSLANNHMMDFGLKGLLDSIKYIKKEKLPFIGAGKDQDKATDYVILGDKVKVGVIALQYKDYMVATDDCPGTSHYKHEKLIRAKVKELKKKVDWVVMVHHGGEEFINTPLPYTRRAMKRFLSFGVDIIVSHHPHTVQGYERIGNKMIFYSLGNFIFDTDFQRAQEGTDKGIVLKIEFTKDDYTFFGMTICNKRSDKGIVADKDDSNFKDVTDGYRKDWKKAAVCLLDVKDRKKELRKYRNKFSISNLYIEKVNIKDLISFNDLVKKYYIDELDQPLVFNGSNIFVRKFRKIYRKLTRANYKKFFYTHYAKIFK